MLSYPIQSTPGDTSWFRADRFGMFIHFGLFSEPARHEWARSYEKITEEEYQKYFDHFHPDLLDAREWAKKAKAAGMKYAVLTAKHHEGFCLFDTKYTDYNVMNTPYGKDIIRQYVEAFRAEGLKVGLYYSLLDWHHPDFPIDSFHPSRDLPNAEALDRGRDMKKYAEYMRNQVTELLTNYGKIDIMWFDFSWHPGEKDANVKPWMRFGGGKGKEQWESEKLIALVRRLQPQIILDDRLEIPQDIVTPEQVAPLEWKKNGDGQYLTWEACQTFSGSWGYHRDETSWKSPEMLVNLLIDSVALGGNLLMNVGPTARGNFDSRADRALEAYGNWMKLHARSIYGCTMAEEQFTAPYGCRLTESEDGKRLYIHIQKYPFAELPVEGLTGKIEYCQFLNDASELLYREQDGNVYIKLPVIQPDVLVPVIEIFLK